MRPYVLLIAVGVGLVAVAVVLGGRAAGIGGALAMVAQTAAVALLRPAMTASQPVFMGRWLGGMGIRALMLGILLAVSATHRDRLALLPAALGYLGVLLPLLFTETRFLR
ncbi:MAG: hypothetical protein AUH78_07915 [Gemmatimonadetes bacterium 13_1_40CM_4_69_8]|nr:MAG: hypothetical protein AUH46_00540 [Gemmatimonadetes bacterium 13_1_40CM_70_15]OLC75982.1 MAG: hypothetical protein AUH78_07915 [Gemmatimonadetes bacterium 13_1_40CM_4_69_8]OLE65525.1 MAG: hypothetical protein AUG03_04425 [Acidobacteria bacterium 13_1_20CM_2_68_14]PYP71447.1 MAG: hypothetical protein DMD41_12365 [Gemmatimonadota bacterium]